MKSLFFLLLFTITITCFAEAGVIIPRGYSFPDDTVLSTDKMKIDVEINNLHATVKIMQIFKNNQAYDLEGEYVFTMPDDAMISDFAIWENGERIKGVIMEKKKARALYENIKARMIDPGLFEKKDDITINKFTVNVFPIPAKGYKRIEIQYTELLPVLFLKANYLLPLKPLVFQEYQAKIKDFSMNFSFKNSIPIKDDISIIAPFTVDFKKPSEFFKTAKFDSKNIEFSFAKTNFVLEEDFIANFTFDIKETLFSPLTYKNTEKVRIDYSPDNNGKKYQDKTGFFMGQIYLNTLAQTEEKIQPKNVLFVFDHSLSMKWLKLATAYKIFQETLVKLNKSDTFNILVWNNETKAIFDKPFVEATDENIKKAKEDIASLTIVNGTDFSKLYESLKAYPAGTIVYLITDGQPTLGLIDEKEILNIFTKKLPNIKFFVLGIGSDVNQKTLSKIAQKSQGFYLHFYETENIDAKIELFSKAVTQTPLTNFLYNFDRKDLFHQVYALNNSNTMYDQSLYTLVGKYLSASETKLNISYDKSGSKINKTFDLSLPDKNDENEFIKRIWAKARIDYLLQQIEETGETQEFINEIIALSKEFTIVTPYTSFLAAPRSLIRPRSIIPGDPVLRVKTDKNITSVTAKFEFGLTKKLTYFPEKDQWEIRFLVPAHLKDGDYNVKLFLIDTNGQTIIEDKSLSIDATPPEMTIKYENINNKIKIIAKASQDTRRIFGYIDNTQFSIVYDEKEKASVGYVDISKIKPGVEIKYLLEDFAHNTTTMYDTVNFKR